MTDELAAAVARAEWDPTVKVIVLRGAGRAFCAGVDFSGGFHQWDEGLATAGRWDPGKDFMMTCSPVTGWVPKFMSLWHSPKRMIAMVHGWVLGGGSEMALCADLVLMSEDARIGTPYSRLWGCHHAGMWVHRLGLAKAKEFALTGRAPSGVEAAACGLVNRAVPFARLEEEAHGLARELASLPLSQLAAMKLGVNQAHENIGLKSTQLPGSVLDGLMRNTPETLAFIEFAERAGVPAAVARRHALCGDYSQGSRADKPDPARCYPSPGDT